MRSPPGVSMPNPFARPSFVSPPTSPHHVSSTTMFRHPYVTPYHSYDTRNIALQVFYLFDNRQSIGFFCIFYLSCCFLHDSTCNLLFLFLTIAPPPHPLLFLSNKTAVAVPLSGARTFISPPASPHVSTPDLHSSYLFSSPSFLSHRHFLQHQARHRFPLRDIFFLNSSFSTFSTFSSLTSSPSSRSSLVSPPLPFHHNLTRLPWRVPQFPTLEAPSDLKELQVFSKSC